MSKHKPYTDPSFGQATWEEIHGEWKFTVAFPSGRIAEGSITPEDKSLPLSSPELEESWACVRWVQTNEPALRQYVADKLYTGVLDWHNPEWGPPPSKEEFRDKLTLVGVQVLEDHRAFLIFNDAEYFGGHAIVFSVGADGKMDEEPYLWG